MLSEQHQKLAETLADAMIEEQKKKGHTDEDIARLIVGSKVLAPLIRVLTSRVNALEDRVEFLESAGGTSTSTTIH